MVFTDPSLVTCLSNDRGYAEAYAEPVRLFGEPADTLIAISSSGNSENILRAVEEARDRHMAVITLSGFDPENRLRKLGRLSFYVPAHAYGMVEVTHLAILHGIIDTVIARRVA
jgi:D-sedoheptulose 7-phosphate isomerase